MTPDDKPSYENAKPEDLPEDRTQWAWAIVLRAGHRLSIHETARLSGASTATISWMRAHLRTLREVAPLSITGKWEKDRRDCWAASRKRNTDN